MKRPKQTDKECKRQGMHDVPVANYSKMQDKYINYLEKKLKNNSVLDAVIKCDCKLERHERAKMELDYNKCMDCKKEIQ